MRSGANPFACKMLLRYSPKTTMPSDPRRARSSVFRNRRSSSVRRFGPSPQCSVTAWTTHAEPSGDEQIVPLRR